MMKWKTFYTGIAQALALATYLLIAALGVNFLVPALLHRLDDALGLALFMLSFATAAVVGAALAFFYPASLMLRGEFKEAAGVLIWTVLGLVAAGLAVYIAALFVG